MADESRYEAKILAAVEYDSRGNAILMVTALLGISLVSVVVRSFVRTRVVRAFGWDDILMLFAMVDDATPGTKGNQQGSPVLTLPFSSLRSRL